LRPLRLKGNKIIDFSVIYPKMQSAGESPMTTTVADREKRAASEASADRPAPGVPPNWLRKTAIYAAVILTLAPLALAIYLIKEHSQVTFLSLLSR
jgi:hypothetical protein